MKGLPPALPCSLYQQRELKNSLSPAMITSSSSVYRGGGGKADGGVL